MSLLKGLSVLWRCVTGGQAGFRASALVTVEYTGQKLRRMGYDPVNALHGGFGDELLNVALTQTSMDRTEFLATPGEAFWGA